VLLEDAGTAREELHGHFLSLAGGDSASSAARDAARRAIVAALRSGDRAELVHDLDRELLGLPRRASAQAAAV
jgi:hypothetical protein